MVIQPVHDLRLPAFGLSGLNVWGRGKDGEQIAFGFTDLSDESSRNRVRTGTQEQLCSRRLQRCPQRAEVIKQGGRPTHSSASAPAGTASSGP